MGKWDKKLRKGKIFLETYGVKRAWKTAEVIINTKNKKTASIKKEEVVTMQLKRKLLLKRKWKLKKQLQKINNFFQIKNIRFST